MIHELKIEECWYKRLVSGEKKCEVRIADRDYQVGDYLRFKVNKAEEGKENLWVLKDMVFEITHVLRANLCQGLAQEYCVLSLDIIEHPDTKKLARG